MPESHDVLRAARELASRFTGQSIAVSSPQGRFAEGAATLNDQVLLGVDAHGRHLFAAFEGGRTLHVQLGSVGGWTISEVTSGEEPGRARGQVRVRWQGEGGWADLRGPTVCEVLDDEGVQERKARLGQDPLRSDADMDVAYDRVRRSRAGIATVLAQQNVVAGVGAALRAEVLFRCGIRPQRPARQISQEQWVELWTDLVLLQGAAARSGRLVTVRGGGRGRAAAAPGDGFHVHSRAGQKCRVCRSTIASSRRGQRSLVWCPTCQT